MKKKPRPIPDIALGTFVITVRPGAWRKGEGLRNEEGAYLGPDLNTKDSILVLIFKTGMIVSRKDYTAYPGKYPLKSWEGSDDPHIVASISLEGID